TVKRFLRPGGWNRLNRPVKERLALIKNMATQLVEKERIRTTLSKAKNLQRYGDKLITLGKAGTRESWLKANDIVRTDRELHKLFTTLALRYKDRQGGYVRLIRAGFRRGDAAPVAIVELVDREGELRQARPAVTPVPKFSVMRWVKQQLDPKFISEPAPLLPPLVRDYLKEQN
uniref:bL17m n=1 Tax=Polytomella magna TaxID=353565 RepID=UPI002240E496|nr:Chain Al, bL17m [Polytomella magna]8APN_Al Chain Al, bL17m [Polytomella magna]8APO_Al Chain Al, bL17m [Polytomella magna]